MEIRLANSKDLPEIIAMFKKIVENMNKNDIKMWDEIYPFEFFEEDIKNKRLYVLTKNSRMIAAFALCISSPGKDEFHWENCNTNALYLNRFGVSVKNLYRGIGSFLLTMAKEIAKSKGAKCLHLLVSTTNGPAINLYRKSGFVKVNGTYIERITGTFTLQCIGLK